MNRIGLFLLLAIVLVFAGCNGQQQKQAGEQTTQQSKNQANQQKTQTKEPTKNKQETKTARQDDRTPDLAGGKEKNVRAPHPMTLADLRKKYPSTFLLNGSQDKRQVALTFDDGPDRQFTPQILDVLKEHNVKATFFLVGNRVMANPDIMERIIREGHEVGNHSYNHPNLPKLADSKFQWQITEANKVIANHSGYEPKFFRPPYGAISEEQLKWVASQNMKMVNWNVDSLDWKGLSAEEVETNILSNITYGAIILQHSAGGEGEDLSGTVKALPQVIKKLKADQVEFVTISTLLDLPKER